MDPLDLVWHLLNLLAPGVALGLIASTAAKWLWRRELAQVAWWGLARWAAGAGIAVTLAGLVLTGRDGRMATYGAMVLAVAGVLWWRGWGRTAAR